jgi:two-component system sensor histidine kinase DegS
MVLNRTKDEANPAGDFAAEILTEVEQTARQLKEVNFMLEQSQAELNKLTQRNTAMTAQLQQLQTTLETASKQDIRTTYDSALDAQQRLYVMRGQIEKLQGEKTAFTKYLTFLEKAKKVMDISGATGKLQKGSAAETVQMLIDAQEVERQHLSRQMHDGPAQALSNFILQTEIAMRLFDVDQGRAKDELANLKTSAMSTFQKVRNYIFELRPMALDDLGMVPAIKRYTETFKEQTGIDAQFQVTGSEIRMAPYLETMIFRSVQELLGYSARLTQASQVKVNINIDRENVHVIIDDNGKGYPEEELTTDKARGLKLIRDRVDMLGGHIEIDNVTDQGTRISFEMPVVAAQAAAPA